MREMRLRLQVQSSGVTRVSINLLLDGKLIALFSNPGLLSDPQWLELRRWIEAAEIGPWLERFVS